MIFVPLVINFEPLCVVAHLVTYYGGHNLIAPRDSTEDSIGRKGPASR